MLNNFKKNFLLVSIITIFYNFSYGIKVTNQTGKRLAYRIVCNNGNSTPLVNGKILFVESGQTRELDCGGAAKEIQICPSNLTQESKTPGFGRYAKIQTSTCSPEDPRLIKLIKFQTAPLNNEFDLLIDNNLNPNFPDPYLLKANPRR